MKYKAFQLNSDAETEKAEKTIPNNDDLTHIHLINYLDRNEDCHIFKYLLDSRLDVQLNQKDFSKLKFKKIANTLEESMKCVLEEVENLTEPKIKDFYLFDEDTQECKLLDAASTV